MGSVRANVNFLGGTTLPATAASTSSAMFKKQNTNKAYQSEDIGGYGGSDGDILTGDTSNMGLSSDGSLSTEESKPTSMSEEELAEIESMPDSNTSSDDLINADDLLEGITSKKMNDFWQLKEEVYLYTIPDKKRHTYLSSFQIDSDKNDIMSTCEFTCPYDSDLMEYWIPGQMTFMIIGGTFDREVLFVGRVSEVNQLGESIQVVGQNLGWKFKQNMKEEFVQKITGQPVKTVVKKIFKELGFDKGKYHINLKGIPELSKYTVDENCSIKKDDEEVTNVPDLEMVVENLKSYDIGEYVAVKSKTREVQEVADDYNKQVQMSALDWVVDAKNSFIPSSYRKSYGLTANLEDGKIVYNPIESRIFSGQENDDYLVVGYSGDSDYTYEDVLHNIASAIDAHFYMVDTTVCFVSFNALFAMSRTASIQKAIMPRIEFWQLEEDSFVLDVSQYGYYNTVEINYRDGTLKRSYDDLVRIYGEVKITYDEPDLSYDAAMLKSQAYLSAHIRDFGMEVQATVLYSGKILPSTFIKLKNPLTMSENLFYVYGISVSWEGDGSTIIADLDLRFGPENPDNPEVPEYGLGYSSGGEGGSGSTSVYGGQVSADVATAAQQMIQGATNPTEKAQKIYYYVDNNVAFEMYTDHKYSDADMLTGSKRANCYDTAWLIYRLCTAVGVKCEVWNGTYRFLDGVYGHLWNKLEINGQMVFADTGRDSKNPIGNHGEGRGIISGRCVAKNY